MSLIIFMIFISLLLLVAGLVDNYWYCEQDGEITRIYIKERNKK